MPGAYFTTGIGSGFGKIVTGTTTVTTAGTAVRITTTSIPIPGVWVGADTSGGPVVIGDSSVDAANGTMQGIILYPANQSIFIPVNNLNLLWVDSRGNGQEVSWAYLQPLSGVTG